MVLNIDVDPQELKVLFHHIQEVRDKAANELMAQQRTVDIERATTVVAVLGKLSRALYDAWQPIRNQQTRKRLSKIGRVA